MAKLSEITLTTRDGSVYAVSHHVTIEGLDYVAIRHHDNVITASIEDVPALVATILSAAATTLPKVR